MRKQTSNAEGKENAEKYLKAVGSKHCPMSDVWDALAIRRCYLKRAGFWFASGKWMICDWLLPTHEITYCSLLLSGWRGYDWTGHTFSRPERWVGPVGPVGLLLFLAELCSEKKLGLPGLGHFFSTTGVERRVRRPCQELPGSFDRSESNPALHRFWMEYRSGRFWSRTVPHSTPRRPQQIDGFKTNSQF